MRKLNIFQVNGVWQLGRPDHADEEDDEDLELLGDHVQGVQPQPAILHDVEMLIEIWVGYKTSRKV